MGRRVPRSRTGSMSVGTSRSSERALAAHVRPERDKGRMSRVWRLAVALPVPVFRVFLGREWFAEPVRHRAVPFGITCYCLLRKFPNSSAT